MCLKNSIRMATNKDIVCYKVLKRRNGKLFSPFHQYLWTLNEVHETPTSCPQVIIDEVWGRAFHTISRLEDARKYKRKLEVLPLISFLETNTSDFDFVICECTIPKDSKFIYEGTTNFYSMEDDKTVDAYSFASQSLKINKIIVEE